MYISDERSCYRFYGNGNGNGKVKSYLEGILYVETAWKLEGDSICIKHSQCQPLDKYKRISFIDYEKKYANARYADKNTNAHTENYQKKSYFSQLSEKEKKERIAAERSILFPSAQQKRADKKVTEQSDAGTGALEILGTVVGALANVATSQAATDYIAAKGQYEAKVERERLAKLDSEHRAAARESERKRQESLATLQQQSAVRSTSNNSSGNNQPIELIGSVQSRDSNTSNQIRYLPPDGAAECIKFSGNDVYNACSKTVHGTFCNRGGSNNKTFGDTCPCSKAVSEIGKYNKPYITSLGCSLHLQPGATQRKWLYFNPKPTYMACFTSYTSTSKGIKITSHDGNKFKYSCGIQK